MEDSSFQPQETQPSIFVPLADPVLYAHTAFNEVTPATHMLHDVHWMRGFHLHQG